MKDAFLSSSDIYFYAFVLVVISRNALLRSTPFRMRCSDGND
ncbi:hypothetical protein SynROS8604_03587 [Synechococcus sp. ROS8604]|nr:hypothetical protein SynROS8604_03587 [Synechococcus sp. ROS8604]